LRRVLTVDHEREEDVVPKEHDTLHTRTEELTDLYSETRILLPGTQVLLGFLVTLPFTQRFPELSHELQQIYVTTFFSGLVAVTLFLTPAAYHRFARPIRQKHAFKLFATKLVLAGLVPLTVSIVLVAYLVTSVVAPGIAAVAASAVALLVLVLWWVLPVLRVHERYAARERRPASGRGLTAPAGSGKDERPCSPTHSASSSTTS
jgi:hypothetical protein